MLRRDHLSAMVRGRWLARGLLAFALLLVAVSPVLAGDMSCTGRSEAGGNDGNYANDFDFGDGVQNDVGVIDGNDPYTVSLIKTVSTLVIDGDCTIKNFTQSNPFPVTNVNYWTPSGGGTPKPSYLIVFDNVYYTGNMACASIPHKLWLTNGTEFSISQSCQDYFIPVEKIDKQVPGSSASIGVPFTYTLNIPVMYDPVTQTIFNSLGSPNALGNIHVRDDLTAAATVIPGVANSGAEMTLAGNITYYDRDSPGSVFTATNNGDNKHLDFTLPDVPAGSQIIVNIPVVLDAGNTPGWQFRNTAGWEFSRFISMDVDGNGTTSPGEGRFFDPLPGDWGVSPAMTISGPNLVVNKSTPSTAVNLSNTVTYTVDVQNTGGWEAWNVRLEDILPQNTDPASAPAKGMCETDPTTFGTGLSARILKPDGTLNRTLVGGGVDYALAWSTTGPNACKIILTLTDSGGAIKPDERLVVTYQTKIDTAFSSGGAGNLVNVAGATHWFNAGSTVGGRIEYLGGGTGVLTDGTPGATDFQDNASVTVAVSGYYFEKTANNRVTGDDPTTTAAAGDTLRYRLHLFNVDQTISNISIADPLDAASFVFPPDIVTCSVVGPVPVAVAPVCSFVGNQLLVSGAGGAPLDLPQGDDLVIEFDVTLRAGLGNGDTVSNQAQLTASGITSILPAPAYYPSDDPNVYSVSDPAILGDEDPTQVTIVTPGPLSKASPAGKTTATIGEQFTYTITVPATAVAMPLYDVQILDTLPANLRFVSASAVVGASALILTDTDGGADSNLVLVEQTTGLDIPANQKAVVTVTVVVENDVLNQSGTTFANTATYTYSRINGGGTRTNGTGDTTGFMTVVEPAVTGAAKSVRFYTPATKAVGSDAATVGDVLEYTITIPNSGNSTAFDTNIVDMLPATLSLVTGSATAQIHDPSTGLYSPVSGFVTNPPSPSGELIWGADNNDDSLDIPAGKSLVLTYRVTVESATEPTIVNSVKVDWSSLDGPDPAERTGVSCPAEPNNYCTGPISAPPISTSDNTSIGKAWVADDYTEPVAGSYPIMRVGDTVTYDLTLNLQEFTTRNVVVEDVLPAGMVFESYAIIAGASGAFSYTLAAQPAAGATGTLTWAFGDIANAPNGSPVDKLVIRYVARVVTGPAPAGVDTAISNLLDNTARLSYTGGDPAVYPGRLTVTARIDVRQPQMRPVRKIDLGNGRIGDGSAGNPYLVNIAADQMKFQLSSCNDGLAPAYGVVITDKLASELKETDLLAAPPVVRIGATTLSAATDYIYNMPARGGLMSIALQDTAPVNPGQCITVDYSIGFHDDLTTQNVPWSNQAQLPEYRSLPLSQPGRIYTATASAQVWMTNVGSVIPLSKTLTSPVEAAIGEVVTYEIRVPATPMNVALVDVQVTDTLHGALEFVSATATLDGAPLGIAPALSGQILTVALGTIPAGQQAVINLRTRVANNDQAGNDGVAITNSASYSYTGMPAGSVTSRTSGPLTIVEPFVTVAKGASTASPAIGELVTFTVAFTASGAGAGDVYSNAFDLAIEDSLSLGLLYEPGTATLTTGAGPVSLPNPSTNGGDGVTAAQILEWSPANGIDIDIAEGEAVTVTYQARVLASVGPGQVLTNGVIGRWSGLNGASAFERDGSGTPAVNDYLTQPATVTMATPLAVSLVKSVVNASIPGDVTGATATPGDTLRYTLVLTNDSVVEVSGISVVDVLASQFAAVNLQSIVAPATADISNSSATGGGNNSGIVDIRGLTLAPQGDAGGGDSVTITFEAVLDAVIDSGTTVPNQAQLSAPTLAIGSNQTSTLISSAPQFQVHKASADMTGDAGVLMAGDMLRYIITVKNTGNENAVNVSLRDLVPAHTSYIAGSTTLNGGAVADVNGSSPLQDGMPIHAPEDATEGAMRADASSTTTNVAIVTFDVLVNTSAVGGTLISNQGFVNGSGAGSGVFAEVPSDDTSTPIVADPTRNVVGNVPLLVAQKTVSLATDSNLSGAPDPLDVVRYTITIGNFSPVDSTGIVLTDLVPANTTYVDNTVTLNGAPVGQPDGGVSPLIAGIPVNSPTSASGTIAAGASAVVSFDVFVNSGVPAGTVISNQGTVASTELPAQLTDADGDSANGYQPTTIMAGSAQQVSVTKAVTVVGGGAALPGSQLEYAVTVTNTGTVPATGVVLTDDLGAAPLGSQVAYVANSAALNGTADGVSMTGGVLSADYAAVYGSLPAGASATLRFRVQVAAGLAMGTTVSNTGQVAWNSPALSASASVDVVIGGIPGTGSLNGRVWHDANLNRAGDTGESALQGWTVDVLRNNTLLGTVTTDADGRYLITGLSSSVTGTDRFSLHFSAPGSTATTAKLGVADSPFVNGLHSISGITIVSGSNLNDLNLPVQPNGVTYDAALRTPVAGAALQMVQAASGTPLPASCFDDPAQQGQVTPSGGHYRFDLNFSDPVCPSGGDFLIQVSAPAGYEPGPSRLIPPLTDATTAAFPVPNCPGTAADAIPATTAYCEAQPSAAAPDTAVPAGAVETSHYLLLTFDNGIVPQTSHIYNNHIAIDPRLDNAVTVSKVAGLLNVTRGQLVPYTIKVTNTLPATLASLSVVDTFPSGFKYVAGSGRLDGQAVEPVVAGNQLIWNNLLLTNEVRVIRLMLVVGAGAGEGKYVNLAQVFIGADRSTALAEDTAAVRVVPDATFDCSDIIGKVFDDANLNGYHDDGEKGLPGVRVVSARGLISTTDEHGRFHLTCAAVPDPDRGSNFILKVDDRSLPTGYRMTTENPRVQRVTRGKMLKFNFGAAIHRAVALDMSDGVFEPGTTEMRVQWKQRLALLIRELEKAASLLRLSYLAETEDESLVNERLESVKREIAGRWKQKKGNYDLTIETQVFWRAGAPPEKSRLSN